jgi:serine/threonine protein kinase
MQISPPAPSFSLPPPPSHPPPSPILSCLCSDLKPENLLYSDPTPEAHLKLADFGLAKLMGPNVLMHTACGYVESINLDLINKLARRVKLDGRIYTSNDDIYT